jgi:hypothetical protein
MPTPSTTGAGALRGGGTVMGRLEWGEGSEICDCTCLVGCQTVMGRCSVFVLPVGPDVSRRTCLKRRDRSVPSGTPDACSKGDPCCILTLRGRRYCTCVLSVNSTQLTQLLYDRRFGAHRRKLLDRPRSAKQRYLKAYKT